jgi:hypothetical protein
VTADVVFDRRGQLSWSGLTQRCLDKSQTYCQHLSVCASLCPTPLERAQCEAELRMEGPVWALDRRP